MLGKDVTADLAVVQAGGANCFLDNWVIGYTTVAVTRPARTATGSAPANVHTSIDPIPLRLVITASLIPHPHPSTVSYPTRSAAIKKLVKKR